MAQSRLILMTIIENELTISKLDKTKGSQPVNYRTSKLISEAIYVNQKKYIFGTNQPRM